MEQPTQIAAEVAQPWARPAVVVPVFVLISLVGGALPSFSLGANLLVLCTGGVMFWLGLAQRLPRLRPRRLDGRAAWWLLPLLAFSIAELINFMLGSTYEHPTLSKLSDPLLDAYLLRAVGYFGWLAAFWAMVRR
jgi:hypothetical protein